MIFFTETDLEHDNWFVVVNNTLHDYQYDFIDYYVKNHTFENAKIRGEVDIRSTKIMWMTDEDYKKDLTDIYYSCTDFVRKANSLWGISYSGWEPFQYGEYSIGDYYDWHIDTLPNGNTVRKISFSLCLSDDYTGGEFELKTSKDSHVIKLKKGEMIIFPSFLLHRVRPVTAGTRKTIVGWSRGGSFQ
jgi:alkylated DNA repair dioxygenase AlkB